MVQENGQAEKKKESRAVKCPVCGSKVAYHRRRMHRCLKLNLAEIGWKVQQEIR